MGIVIADEASHPRPLVDGRFESLEHRIYSGFWASTRYGSSRPATQASLTRPNLHMHETGLVPSAKPSSEAHRRKPVRKNYYKEFPTTIQEFGRMVLTQSQAQSTHNYLSIGGSAITLMHSYPCNGVQLPPANHQALDGSEECLSPLLGSQSGLAESEGPQAQLECRESPKKLQKDKKNKEGPRQEGPLLHMEDSVVLLKVEMIVDELNKLIENRIVENEKKKQGIMLFDVDDKSPLAKEILSTTVL
ncbi:hypothetical protein CRG98_001947 [Punica granatum]|uniref:Uncharacterized protein n=1 Tax=Punica granatum TaxID=22663 RepID=A0A2I0LAE6_PUNGR|nr:hypothetical protein CRG98_001947 [Punica granatum]